MKLRYTLVVVLAALGLTGCSLTNNTDTNNPKPASNTATSVCNDEGTDFYVPTPYAIYQTDQQLNSAGFTGFCVLGATDAVNSHVGYSALDDTSASNNAEVTGGEAESFSEAQSACQAMKSLYNDSCTIVTDVWAGNG